MVFVILFQGSFDAYQGVSKNFRMVPKGLSGNAEKIKGAFKEVSEAF